MDSNNSVAVGAGVGHVLQVVTHTERQTSQRPAPAIKMGCIPYTAIDNSMSYKLSGGKL
jgi:hypothetical protein